MRLTFALSLRVMLAMSLLTAGLFTITTPTSAATNADAPRLGAATDYAAIAAATITNTGDTLIEGSLALSPGTSVTGGPTVMGDTNVANANAIDARNGLITAYTDAANAAPTADLTGLDLGGQILTPGVYSFSSFAQLTGTLILDGQGATNPTFIFQIGSTLTTASNANIQLINGAGSCAVFWQVGSSATLGTATDFQGTIMADQSITLNGGATIGFGGSVNGGRALAVNAALTLDNNQITLPSTTCGYASAPPADISVSLHKQDQDGIALPDVSFNLSNGADYSQNSTTTTTGNLAFEGLGEGAYALTETVNGNANCIIDGGWTLSVNNDNGVLSASVTDAAGTALSVVDDTFVVVNNCAAGVTPVTPITPILPITPIIPIVPITPVVPVIPDSPITPPELIIVPISPVAPVTPPVTTTPITENSSNPEDSTTTDMPDTSMMTETSTSNSATLTLVGVTILVMAALAYSRTRRFAPVTL